MTTHSSTVSLKKGGDLNVVIIIFWQQTQDAGERSGKTKMREAKERQLFVELIYVL